MNVFSLYHLSHAKDNSFNNFYLFFGEYPYIWPVLFPLPFIPNGEFSNRSLSMNDLIYALYSESDVWKAASPLMPVVAGL